MSKPSIQDQHGDPLADSLRFTIDIAIPPQFSAAAYQSWARYLMNETSWPKFDSEDSHFQGLVPEHRLFIESHFALWQVFFELGRLPVFDIFRLHSLVSKEGAQALFRLEVDFLKLDHIPLNAYQIPINSSLKIAQWLSQQKVQEKTLGSLYRTINEEVIQAMHRIVPGGQSTIPLLKTAHQLGIPYTHLSQGVYQIGWGSKALCMDRSTSSSDAILGAKLSQNKLSTAHILRAAGLPAPYHQLVYGEQDALAAAQAIGFPVVVKPADQDRGEGVTVGVIDNEALRRAFVTAQRISKAKEVLIERQVPGTCHRLVVVGEQLLYAVKRQPMGIYGDGVHTITQRVQAALELEQEKPLWLRSQLMPIDTLARDTLKAEGWTLDSVPAVQEFVALRPIESTAWGGVDEDVTERVHPQNLRMAIQAARLLHLDIAGIDLLTTDIALPWYQNGAIINEVNYAPLLGGAAISRSYLPQFFRIRFPAGARIPLEIFNENSQAQTRRQAYLQANLRVYWVHPGGIIDPQGQDLVMPLSDSRARIKALMMRADVDAIIALI